MSRLCAVFCGGDPVSRKTFETCPAAEYNIAADSGYILAQKLGVTPDLIIGDFDSAPKPAGGNIITFPVEKDDTDLMLALRKGLELGYDRYLIFGATGGRIDHTLAAVQSLAFLTAHNASGEIVSDTERITLLTPGEHSIPYMAGFSLSLFAYSERVSGLCIEGAKYTCRGVELDSTFPLGASNQVMSEEAKVSFTSGLLLAVRASL